VHVIGGEPMYDIYASQSPVRTTPEHVPEIDSLPPLDEAQREGQEDFRRTPQPGVMVEVRL